MTETPTPENIVPITDKIMQDGPKAAADLEQKRRIAMKAFEITMKQLEADAGRMEQSAILGEHDMKTRHQMMNTAEALRVAGAWLQSLMPQVEPKPPGGN